MARIKGSTASGKAGNSGAKESKAHAAAPAEAPEVGEIPGGAAVISVGTANYGAAKVVALGADDKAELGMAFAPFKTEIVDIDVVLVFADGSKIIIPGMALAAFTGRKPMLVFTDKEISADQAVSTVGEIKEQVAPIKLALSSANSEEQSEAHKDGDKPQDGGGVQPGDSSASQAENAAEQEQRHTSDADSSRLTEKIASTPSSSGPPPSSPSARAIEPSPDDAIGPAGIGKLVPKLTLTLYNKEGVSTGIENGETTIKGSTGGPTSSTDAKYAAQSAKETITGTAQRDIIYADNPAQAPNGATLRTLHVEAMVPAKGLDLFTITIPSLPAGYSIANGTLTSKGWVVDVSAGDIQKVTSHIDPATGQTVNYPANQSHFTFDLQLIYTVPDPSTPAASSGFQDEFFLPAQLGLSSYGGPTVNAVQVSTAFGIKIVNSAADMTVTNPVSGDPIYVLFSNPPGNIINAGDGDDKVVAGIGADDIDGGNGKDVVSYERSVKGVDANLGTATGHGGSAEGDHYANVEGLTGSAYDDTLTGDANDNIFDGGAGADHIDGGAGNDTVDYSQAIDPAATGTQGVEIFLDGSASHGGQAEGDVLSNIETVIGSDRDDRLHGGAGAETLQGGAGSDRLFGSAGADALDGGAGIDTADYSTSASGVTVALDGTQGSGGDAQGDVLSNIENLVGSAFDDTLTGDAGDNLIVGGAGADHVDGGAGVDTVDFTTSGVGVTVYLDGRAGVGGDAQGDTYLNIEQLIGSDYADRLVGAVGSQTLHGGLGDDVIEGGAGADVIDGGDGFDIASYAGAANGVIVALDGSQLSGGDPVGDVFISIEGLEGSAFDDTLIGTAGNDALYGLGGNDTLLGLGGADLLDGGAGFDTVDYSLSLAAVTVRLDGGLSQGGDAEGDTLVSIEHVIGSALDDTLIGGAGDDQLEGRAGDDILRGGGGADILMGGTGLDTADYSGSLSGVIVALDGSLGIGGDAQGDQLSGIERLVGSAFDDTLTGDDGDNILRGGAGNDTLAGGLGADTLMGEGGFDTADYSAAQGAVTVRLDGNASSGDIAQGDRLTGIEHVVGGAYADSILGDSGDNVLDGGAGDDVLQGGLGADSLIGGAGIDTADYSDSVQGVTVSLATGTGTGGSAQGDTLSGVENLTGSNYNDSLSGDTGANILSGGAGDDILAGGAGADSLDGGTGNDIADYSGSNAAVQVALDGSVGIGGDAAGDILSNIEGITGSAFDDTLSGNDLANRLDGGVGNDVLRGGLGSDQLIGGAGFDTADYSQSVTSVLVSNDGSVGLGGDAQGDILSGIERIVGSGFDDQIRGSAGADTLEGGAGNDILEGRGGADSLDGGAGTDIADYSSSANGIVAGLDGRANTGGDATGDTYANIEGLSGSAFADTLYGSVNDDILRGQGGNDTLMGSAGADALEGGTGFDTVDYSASAAAVTVNLSTGSAAGGDAAGDTLSGIERVVGSAFDDSLTGGDTDDVLEGGAGNDTLAGRLGADVLDGGAGYDTADYTASATGIALTLDGSLGIGGDAAGDSIVNVEHIIGSTYDDTITGVGADEFIEGGGGDDILSGNAGDDILTGGSGNDTLSGGVGVDTLQGGSGDDIIEGGAGADIIDGGSGIDIADYTNSTTGVTVGLDGSTGIGGDAAGDTLLNIEALRGSAFDDTLTGGVLADQIEGGAGNDLIRGGAGADSLFGGSGDDIIEGGAGGDLIDGGTGIDTADYSASASGVTVSLDGSAGLGGHATGDTLLNIERVIGTGSADHIIGAAADEELYGGGGDDILEGRAGADLIDGGAGIDTADYSSSIQGVTVDLALGIGLGGDAQGDTLVGIENLLGSTGADTLLGAATDDQIDGGAGDDTLVGRAGNDHLIGGAGNDILDGGAGADTLEGGAGFDTVDYSTSTVAVSVGLDGSVGIGGDAQGDVMTGIERLVGSAFNDTLTGGVLNDQLEGGAGDDIINGGVGNDTLLGGAGNDVLAGGAGADVIDGGAGIDTVDYSASTVAVTIHLDGTVSSGGDATGDQLTNIENLTATSFDDLVVGAGEDEVIHAGAGDDDVFGGAGNDVLYGDGGDDVLDGGLGADQLIGGNGNDTASYANATSGVAVSLDGSVGTGGEATGDTLSGIENLVGSAYNDVLGGGIGTESITGGAGDDRLLGSQGADVLDGGSGVDVVDYSASAGAVTITLDGSTGIGGDAAGDQYISIEGVIGSTLDDTLNGGLAADIIDGGAGNDNITGGGGNDTLLGGAGDDSLDGGAGADLMDGGSGIDTVDYSSSTSGVNVSVDGSVSTGGAAQGDQLLNIENLIGSAYDDVLLGTSADDTLDGGSGNDVLGGRGGADQLLGGAGFDTADYSDATSAIAVSLATNTGTLGDALQH
jgi:Ca2+-binding RTX toxin-like protein